MEPELIGDLINRLADSLQLYARQWCDAPEDVVQDAFMALACLRAAPDDPTAWLFRSVRNGAINAGIARRRRLRREAEAASGASAWFGPPADRRKAAVDPDSAQAALSGLPVEQREVIVAHIWGGQTFEQIARLAGTSSSSAHRIYQAGLSALRGRLGVPCPTNSNASRNRPTPK